jgi:hypothetical protein
MTEQADFPGFANIEFQRRRHFAFEFLRSDLDSMARFAKKVEGFLEAESQRLERELSGSIESAASRAQSELAEIRNRFEDYSRAWLLVGFYGRFESFLFDLCRSLEETGVLSMEAPSRGGLPAVKKYLKRVEGLVVDWGGNAWSSLKDIAELRNAIAHENQVLRRSSTPARKQAISRIPHVRISAGGEIWPEAGLLEHVTATLKSFAEMLRHAFGPSGRIPVPRSRPQ